MGKLKHSKSFQSNEQGFFSLESLLGILMLVIALSWVITAVMNASVVQDAIRQEDVAQAHAEYLISNIQKAPLDTLAHDIRQGNWNYPNAPALAAAGLIPLRAESIMTEVNGEGILQVTVTVRWQNQNGETKAEVARVQVGG